MGQIEYTGCATGKRTESPIFGACKIYPGAVSFFGVVDGGPPARQNYPTKSFTPKPRPFSVLVVGINSPIIIFIGYLIDYVRS